MPHSRRRSFAPRLVACLLATLAAPSLLAQGEDPSGWPAWRGPDGTGSSAADPPVHWSESENVLWKAALPGHGKSTPIVHGERIFLLAAVPGRPADAEELRARDLVLQEFPSQLTAPPEHFIEFLALAISRKDGTLLWKSTIAEALPIAGVHETNGYGSFSPVTDGVRLYVSLGSYGVSALDLDSGDVLWRYDLGPQITRRGWGEAGSPALDGELLFVCADQEGDSRLHALESATGKPRWVVERDEPTTWTVPLVIQRAGANQLVVNGSTQVRSYDVTTGELLWSAAGQTLNAIPSPVSDGERVVVTSGFRGSACMAFPLGLRGDLAKQERGVLWSHGVGTPYVPSPLLTDGRVYFLAANSGRLSCIELETGKLLLDRERLDLANVYASPIAAAGRIYVVGRDGTTVVLRHDDELTLLGVNVLDDPIDASPVAVGRVLYLRSDEHLYAIAEG